MQNIFKDQMKNSCDNSYIKYSELQPRYKEYHQVTSFI